MSTLRKPRTVGEFVESASANTLGASVPIQQTRPEPRQERASDLFAERLNPRVLKQVNIKMPETDHHVLKTFIDSLPRMSMQRFILEAVAEKMERMRSVQ